MDFITAYIDQYGYLVLFLGLILELLALPLPGELLMSYAGYLVYQGHLNWFLSIVIAGMGSSVGMTISYWIGYKLGTPFFEKYGHRFHLGPERLKKVSEWFTSYGNKILIIAYYIPGIRHITGYFSGITQIPFKTYALFAYLGAFIWVSVFISLGKILGPQWDQFHSTVKKYLVIAGVIGLIILCIIYVIRRYKNKIQGAVIGWINKLTHLFHTQRGTAIFMVGIMVISLGFVILMFSMTQDFLANEFNDFNDIVTLLVPLIFNTSWEQAMQVFLHLGSQKLLITLPIITFLFVLWKGKEKLLESILLILVVVGGELYEEGIRRIFHLIAPIHNKQMMQFSYSYSFPSEQSLMAFVIYGLFIFMLVRHTRRAWIHTIGVLGTLIIFLLMAISRIYFEIQLASEVVAGYVFGGVWLSLNILLLESLRLMGVASDRKA